MTSLSLYEKAMTSLPLSRQKSEGENQQDSGYTDRRKLGTDQIIPIYQCKTSMYSVKPSESRKKVSLKFPVYPTSTKLVTSWMTA